MKLMIYC